MPKLVVYNSMSLDGYFTDANGDMSWAHKRDPEWQAFVAENARGGGQLLFGRVTYDLMVDRLRDFVGQRTSGRCSLLPSTQRSDPGVVSISPDSSSVFIPDRIIGQPP